MPQGEVELRRIVAGLFVSLDGVVELEDESIAPYFNGWAEQML